MREQLEIVYTMDVLEFAIAVNLMGKKSVMAPGSVRESASVEEVLKTLQIMVNKHMIAQSGTTFALCGCYKELFWGIVNAFGILEISVRDHRRLPICCYMGESVWCVMEDIMNPGRIKCRRIDDLSLYLEENGYFPVSMGHSRITAWEDLKAEEGNVAEGETLLEMVYKCERTGKEEWRIGINEGTRDTVLWVSEAGCCHIMDYNFEKISFFINEINKEGRPWY